MTLNRAYVLLAALALGAAAWLYFGAPNTTSHQPYALQEFDLNARPQADRYLFDYAGALHHYEEGTHKYLRSIATRFHTEALIVSVPTLPDGHNVATLANDLFNRWRIGAGHEGRGLLLLLIDDTKTVKLEVAYALEDVFTDAFVGFVEDLQLGPNYRAGDLSTGLIAVMELLEARAEIKHQSIYTTAQIAQADGELLAGGAGATRELVSYEQVTATSTQQSGSGARSPREAWEIMLSQWGGAGANTDVDTYTTMSRRAMGDPNDPDPRTTQELEHWRNADYEVLQDGDHAVIWFGAIDGWNNAPFLFCNTGDGWKFDIVHQRRLIIMADAPKWQVSQGPYPYAALMHQAKQTTSKDLPLEDIDLYRCDEDAAIHTEITKLEQTLAQHPDDIVATIALLRLNVITGQRPNLVRPLIDRAKRLAPETAEIYRYAAIYNVNTFFQYETALAEIAQFLDLRPQDPFGHRMQGFLLYRLGRYQASIDVLQQLTDLDSNDGYAYSLMARNYALLARKANGSRKRKLADQADDMRNKATAAPTSGAQRISWLNRWLAGRLG